MYEDNMGGGVLLRPTLGGTEFSKDLGKHEEMAGVFGDVVCAEEGSAFIWIVFRGYLFCSIFFRILRVRPSFLRSVGLFCHVNHILGLVVDVFGLDFTLAFGFMDG